MTLTVTLQRRLTAFLIFAASLTLYILTAEPTVSYWDCPEYVTTAMRMEPGHPPGNPVWMLTARVFTLFSPTVADGALAVNIMSGVCSAIAVTLLFLTLTILIPKLLPSEDARKRQIISTAGGIIGAAVFAVSDTFWFSAVEAEVYAMSAMLTALVIWLTFLWGEHRNSPGALRYLLLVAYITGLSIGVHQLNLLVLPCLALIVLFYRHKNLRKGVYVLAMAASLLIIAAILFGMMPGVLSGAAKLELLMVNQWHLPLHSGIITYCGLTILTMIVALVLTTTPKYNSLIAGVAAFPALWLSGLFSIGGNIWLGAAVTAIILILWFIFRNRLPRNLLNLSLWSAVFLFIGYCSYGIILLRGTAEAPMNQGDVTDIFALTSYLNREQYGEAPLLYGKTPYSSPLYAEERTSDSTAVYKNFARRAGDKSYANSIDSSGRPFYREAASHDRLIYTPELNMWLPRLHSSAPDDIDSYRGWVGLDSASMVEVETSYALDSSGKPVGRLVDGKYIKDKKLRPTYWQNFLMFGGYQLSYMYMRYLMWNFLGRQNEVYAQGESDAGNFITGVNPLDALMLEHPELMPDDIGRDNPGHHVYWFLPLLLLAIGIFFQLSGGKEGRRQFAVVTLLFVLTGIAIVVYLNQTPGQPRERDYSFVGSFYACCIWIGLGAGWLVNRGFRGICSSKPGQKAAGIGFLLLCLATPVIMFCENLPDHNRSNRTATRDFAMNIITPLPKDAILFVNGDNFTFPLWYLREVEGIRRDVTIVNLAYLGTTWYPPQLAVPAYGAPALRFTIPTEQLNKVDLGSYSVVNIGYGTADASTALRQLFETPLTNGVRPRINADRVRLALPGTTDSVTIDLHALAGGHSYLRLNHLMILDILASNPDRQIFWHEGVKSILPVYMSAEGLNRRFGAIPGDSLQINSKIFLEKFRSGGLNKNVYVDMPGRQQTYMHRHAIAQTALALTDRNGPGDMESAEQLAELSLKLYPANCVPYTTLTNGGVPYSEALELAEIYRRLWADSGKEEYKQKALYLINNELARTSSYSKYVESLSPRYKRYTKGSTRLSAAYGDSLARAMKKEILYK